LPLYRRAQEQKQRNLDSNPQVAITTGSTGANGWDSGKEEFVELSDSGGSTTGGARVYRVTTAKVIALGDARGQTTYRF
jgi:hypothetical protein